MSTKYKFHDPDACYFVTFAVVGWVDLFTRNVYKDILLESWRYCQQQKGLLIHAYVIMTNHVHMIISKNSDTLLEAIMRDMKKFTSSKLLEAIKKEPESRREWMLTLFRQAGENNSNNKIFQLWQQDNHPIECESPTILSQKIMFMKIQYGGIC